VIGGGPGGSTTARELARAGFGVTLLEADSLPRFHIGESFLPRGLTELKELGLADRLANLPQVHKLGAEFLMGHGKKGACYAWFSSALLPGEQEAFHLERAPFDKMLLDAAREAGVTVLEKTRVRQILRLDDGDVRLAAEREGETVDFAARMLVDASGQATVVGRHLGTRTVLPHLKKVAYFGHFRGVQRAQGDLGGLITVVMCREGWFWIIPLDEERTSIGLVMNDHEARKIGVPARQMLAWALERCPVMAERCRGAQGPSENEVTADFSYTCRPFAGPGYFLVGDAATFVDPVFSTGVCLSLASARQAALAIHGILRHGRRPEPLRRAYRPYIEDTSATFFRLVYQFYEPAFRDLFLNEEGPFSVHKAVISVLAGHVFPRPPFAVRWRLHLFALFLALQKRFTLVPRHEDFSLLEADPVT
ncbi:MAG: tryptophan 7-halogenase, partial [Acidobacteria bacterium]|nr:tryptophan 7-halogenase [Acidobacteriota bacterium]